MIHSLYILFLNVLKYENRALKKGWKKMLEKRKKENQKKKRKMNKSK